MVLEKDDTLKFFNRLGNWLEENGLSEDYFFNTLKEIGLAFPIRITNYTENPDKSFSFVCSTVSEHGEPIKYTISLDSNKPLRILFCNSHGFWEQPMKI